MTVSSTTASELHDVLDDPRLAARLRILRHARHLVADRGLGVSMAELAEAAGVGRRTVFRYFGTREELIAAALDSALDWYQLNLELAVSTDQTFEVWLHDFVAHLLDVHRRSGRGLWQLAGSFDDDLPPALAAVNRRRKASRRAMTETIAATAWARAGGKGRVPDRVVDAIGMTISSFTTHSMIDDLGCKPQRLAASASSMLAAVLLAAIDNDPMGATR